MDFTVGKVPAGRIVFELFPDIVNGSEYHPEKAAPYK